jgi:predicted transcriptional regulator
MHSDKLAGAVHRDSRATIDESRVELTLEVIQALTANDLIQARASERELRQSAYRETEANVFAAALVMPTSHLCRFIDQGLTDTTALAKAFGVSAVAMDWRLRFLDACMGIPEASTDSQGQGTLF